MRIALAASLAAALTFQATAATPAQSAGKEAELTAPPSPLVSILDRFEGTWTADTEAFRQPARSTMRWSRAVEGKWWRLEYRIDFKAPQVAPFAGVAYYKTTAPGRHVATWVDSTGDLHPIEATDDGSALTSLWGVPGEKYGKSEYRFTATGVEVTDWIQREGAWLEFNRTRFVRAAG